MPYTPPTRSPASTNSNNSPIITRNHSYEGTLNQNQRPGLPRSRSAIYLQKHRRTPSIADQQPHSHHVPGSVVADGTEGTPLDVAAVAKSLKLSTSGSPVGLDDEDRSRGRQLKDLADSLKETMVISKRHSPTREGDVSVPKSMPATRANGSVSPALTPEARKIAHSRSSSDIHLSKMADVPSQAASSDESDDDEGLTIKPPLLRKKSGELVKPALRASSRRPSSMPGTPTFSKAVHFNEQIAQVRHFLMVDRPIAVSAGSSPVETYDSEGEYPFGYDDGHKSSVVEWEIRTSNFPRDSVDRHWQPVRTEKLFLSADMKNLVGVAAVANMGYQKWVVARFTLDYWKTTSEVVAEYNNDVRRKQANDGYDRFNFNIKLSDQANLETKTMLVCVRYNVNGQEYWDNNNNMNYQVDFIKKTTPRPARQAPNAGTLGAIPRSRHSPSATGRPRSFPASNDDDFGNGFAFGNTTTLLRDPQKPASYRAKNQPRKNSSFPVPQARKSTNNGAFASRYDFGTSLSMALVHAQVEQLHDEKQKKQQPTTGDYFAKPATGRAAAPAVQPVNGATSVKPTPAGQPELHSKEYNELIQKYCYFGSKQGSPGAMSPDPNGPTTVSNGLAEQLAKKPQPQVDGISKAVDSGSDNSAVSSAMSSASSSPPSPRVDFHQYDGTHDSHRSSRSSTPIYHPTTSPRLLAQYRSPSPALYELPHQVMAQ